ncbi:hypothetical protein [Bradyrhizobium elkanii]|uniref:hypothetical protein n=1 Tax=Bradyrhizobium elkanii TaxID=29448 RepID=UPI000484844A|nr:hypothetical protein [Bradyrhizobium elkanii]WLA44030.1 hypothetical protein QNJ95_22405 [Bradyrhizobium elkanii]WLC11855.1 hypothetical protein QIH86_21570 [Bradyrhizobium elkanii USDA 94]
MAYQLRLGEMIEAMYRAKMPDEVKAYTDQLEKIGTEMSKALAAKIGVNGGEVTYGAGMFAAPFWPATEGQPLPEELEDLDCEDCWGED